MGNKNANYPRLSSGVMRAPASATLRITDGHKGKTKTLVVRSRAFQLTVEEARATPYVVISMYLSLIFPT